MAFCGAWLCTHSIPCAAAKVECFCTKSPKMARNVFYRVGSRQRTPANANTKPDSPQAARFCARGQTLSVIAYGDATSPEGGRFCSTYRKMPKSSPFRGSWQARQGLTERVPSGIPLPSCRFASSHLPQGDGFSGGDKVSGSALRRPLGGAVERSETEGVIPRKKAVPKRPQAFRNCNNKV